MKKIVAKINKKTGALTLQTVGFEGEACLEATRKLREQMRIEAEPEKTAEYYTNTTDVNLTQGL